MLWHLTMLRDVERKFVLTQSLMLVFFAWGVGFLYLVSTVLFNPVQLHWEMFCFAWEAIAFGVPLIVFRPMFRPIERYARQLEGGSGITAEQAAVYHQKILAYPFKVAVEVFLSNIAAYILGVMQVRYFARLPWDGVVVTLICGVTSGLLWAVLEYFLLEHDLRPLTGLAFSASRHLPASRERVSLRVKIFLCSLSLVVASLGFSGVVAYTRAARSLEEEIGMRVSNRMHELANLLGTLPPSESGGLSDSWWMLAADFPISPRGYFRIIDASGKVMATHPKRAELGITRLQDEDVLPAVYTKVLTDAEGRITDRVDSSKIVTFVSVPGTRWKIVAVVPVRDFSPQLDQLLYSGLAGMGFALLLSLGIGFLCARGITTSLAEVTKAARAVAEKRDLRQRVKFLTNDEVGVLAHAFNQMAEGLQTYAEGLEHVVAERTEQLQHRTTQLEAKNGELSDFLYIASHDLRAPLINLAGFSQALQDSVATLDGLLSHSNGTFPAGAAAQWPQLKEDIVESLDFILRSTAKMDVLVNALLDLSRIDTRPHAQQAIDTRRVVEEIVGTFRFQIDERKISLVLGSLPVVMGDPVRLNQVFSNLIDNAIKYMPKTGDARIEVGCEEAGDAYRFFVRDSGRGIRAEDHDKVFRLFTRLSANGVPGEGVGLAAVRKIIEKHGGQIGLTSELGMGSTFWFTLPRNAQAQSHTTPAAL